VFALDTNTLIYFFKQEGQVASHLKGIPANQVFVPAVVWFELEYGVLRSTRPELRRRGMESVQRAYQILNFDAASAKSAARIKHALDAAGTPIGNSDLLIAATALASDLTLVTRNRREFERVPGLRVENWYDN
jgi:tRNA(fMet)-specific endonuclease VapC